MKFLKFILYMELLILLACGSGNSNGNNTISSPVVYLTPNFTSYKIKSDNTDTMTQNITVVNSGDQNITLNSPSFTLSSTLNSLTGLHVTDGCAGSTLKANSGSTCIITVTYGPVATPQTVISGNLNITYNPIPTSSNTVIVFATESFQALAAASVSLQSIVKSGAIGGSGLGTINSPYQFYNSPYPDAPIILTYTYKNTGTEAATDFLVNINNLPNGYTIFGSPTCGYAVTSSILPAGGTCSIAITAISPATSWNPYSLTSPINVVTPSYSYTDSATGYNSISFNTITYITPMLFANITTNNILHSTATSGGNYNVTFTSNGGDANEYSGTGLIITIPSSSLTNNNTSQIYLTSANNCKITTLIGGTCDINITNQAGTTPATYTYQYWITPQGLVPSANNSIIKLFSFTLN